MNIKKQNIYTVVDVNDELPIESRWYSCNYHNDPTEINFMVEEQKDMYVFTDLDFKEFVKKVYDDCWANTGEGWNGEIQPHGYFNKEELEYYEHRKDEYIKSLNL